jgi:hypothetical protein
MFIRMTVSQNGETIFQRQIEVTDKGVGNNAKLAFDEFHREFPGASTWDDNLKVVFDKA